jgi:hypothetical protein
MAQGTLQSMARQVQAYSPNVPYNLARQWIIDRYRQITETYLWSFKIGEGTFATSNEYSTGTITLTNGSTTVTGSGTTFTSAMTNRQLKVDDFIFNFTYVGATSGTIDKAWLGSTTAGLNYSIVQGWITPANADFHAFISVIDPANGWKLHTHFTSFDLDRIDPQRSSTGTPYCIASRSYNGTSPRYELWPYSTTQRQFTYMYVKRIADLALNSDTPHNIIRSDILVKGALAELARWPGTKENPNPFYDPYFNQYKARQAEYDYEVNRILLADQNIYMTDLNYYTDRPFAPLGGNYWPSHA